MEEGEERTKKGLKGRRGGEKKINDTGGRGKVTRLIASAEHEATFSSSSASSRFVYTGYCALERASARFSVALLSRAAAAAAVTTTATTAARKPEIYARNYKLFLAGRDLGANAGGDYREA